MVISSQLSIKSGNMALGLQIWISILLLQSFLLADAFVMPQDDPWKVDAVYEFCAKNTSVCLAGYKKADSNCLEAKDCSIIVGFEKVDGTYVFQTLTAVNDTLETAFVALGISAESGMVENIAVVECMLDKPDSNAVNVHLSYTINSDGGWSTQRLSDQTGVKPAVKIGNEDYIYCQFSLSNPLNLEKFSITLDGDNEYYLSAVAGTAKKDGQNNYIGIERHRQSSMVSEDKYFKNSGDNGGGGGGSSSIVASFFLIPILLLLTKFC